MVKCLSFSLKYCFFGSFFFVVVSGHIQVSRTAEGDRDGTLIERGQHAAVFPALTFCAYSFLNPEAPSTVPCWPSESELLVKGLKGNIKRGEKELKKGLQIQ